MIYRHTKTGVNYTLVAFATIEIDLTPAVVYKSMKDGRIWVRPEAEFFDGRFVEVVRECQDVGGSK